MQTKALFNTIESNIIGNELMTLGTQIDRNANGVQIWGGESVKKVALGVSCNAEFLEKAVKWEADVCIFHHGLGVSDRHIYNSRFDLSTQRQLRLIFQHDLTIAGYHFVLDAHKEIGNNAVIIRELGAKRLDVPYFDKWGWVAEFAKPRFVQEVANDCAKIFKHDIFMVMGGPEQVKRIGVCSGGAKPSGKELFELLDLGVELHISGEIDEGGPARARENGFNYFAGGHYATEVFGVKALGEEIKKAFPETAVEFIDVWNEL